MAGQERNRLDGEAEATNTLGGSSLAAIVLPSKLPTSRSEVLSENILLGIKANTPDTRDRTNQDVLPRYRIYW